MTCKPGIEGTILAWLGRCSVALALFALLLSLADPVGLLLSFIALILGGFSAIAGKARYCAIDSLIVAATGVLVFVTFPPPPDMSWLDRILMGGRIFMPPYLVAGAFAMFGRWRVQRHARLAAIPPASLP